jgi:hypothetical protein
MLDGLGWRDARWWLRRQSAAQPSPEPSKNKMVEIAEAWISQRIT